MTKLPPITLLRPGTFTAEDGSEHSYTEADLVAIAAGYDATTDPAPLVIGHPKTDHPAWGWVKGLAIEGGELVAHADPDTLDPAFAEIVNGGRYRKVSASFYPPKSKFSPKPGASYLKHIGFLGARAPGVKGLGTVAFAEGEDLITIETTKETQMRPEDKTADFAEREADITRRLTDVETREAAIAERETALAAAADEARHAGNVAFAEALVEGGKLAPAGKDLAVIILDGLSASEDAAVSFGEADEKITPDAAFKRLFEKAGAIVAFGEHAGGKAPEGDQEPQHIADRAVAYAETQQAAGRTITIAAAVRHVIANPD